MSAVLKPSTASVQTVKLLINGQFVESKAAAVEVIGRIIRIERIVTSVEMKLRAADAPSHASDDGAKTRMWAEVVGQIVKAQHDIDFRVICAGHTQGGDDAAVIRDVA